MTDGRLVLVGTPIGNLDDISARAVRALSQADVIYCEDTRRTRKLLSAIGVGAPRLVRLDQHNERSSSAEVIRELEAGRVVVLTSDAGMPTLSDPGSWLVRDVTEQGLDVEVVPGPTAVVTALALSGFPAVPFRFAGFPPRKGRERADFLQVTAADSETVVLYESPNRVARTVADLADACGGDRPLVLARELTKLHEEVWRGTLAAGAEWLADGGDPLGEWVVVLGPVEPAPKEVTDQEILAALAGADPDSRQAVGQVAKQLDVPKRRVYDLVLMAKKGSGTKPSMP